MRTKDVSIVVGVIVSLLIASVLGFAPKKNRDCVQVFYDQTVNYQNEKGHQDSEGFLRILRSFPQYQAILMPIESYHEGDLSQCHLNVYLGSYAENKLPRSFINDLFKTDRLVLWMGLNIWQLGELMEQKMGLRYIRQTSLEKSGDRSPSYFSEVLYRDRLYRKLSKHGTSTSSFDGPFAQAELLPTDLEKFDSIAEVRNPATREVIPYIVRAKNLVYVADTPFESTHAVITAQLLQELL